jgi:hypothetical protein
MTWEAYGNPGGLQAPVLRKFQAKSVNLRKMVSIQVVRRTPGGRPHKGSRVFTAFPGSPPARLSGRRQRSASQSVRPSLSSVSGGSEPPETEERCRFPRSSPTLRRVRIGIGAGENQSDAASVRRLGPRGLVVAGAKTGRLVGRRAAIWVNLPAHRGGPGPVRPTGDGDSLFHSDSFRFRLKAGQRTGACGCGMIFLCMLGRMLMNFAIFKMDFRFGASM